MEKEWREKGGGRGGNAAGRQSAIGGRQWPWGHVQMGGLFVHGNGVRYR